MPNLIRVWVFLATVAFVAPACGGGGRKSTGTAGNGGAAGAAGSSATTGAAGTGGAAGGTGTGGAAGGAGSSGTAGTDAGAGTDASGDVGSSDGGASCTGACNMLTQIGTLVSRRVLAGAPPVMTGGTIADGTYVLTDIVQYGDDATPYALKETVLIAGNIDSWVVSTGGDDSHSTATFVVSLPNKLDATVCCPSPAPISTTYTATANTLSDVDPSNSNRVFVFTKQP